MTKSYLNKILFSLILFPLLVSAQENVGLPFLKIGAGARQAGMGGVFTGVGDDIQTLTWNPGGLFVTFLSGLCRWESSSLPTTGPRLWPTPRTTK